VKDLPYLINLPPFMYRGVEVENFSFFQKIKFILKGQLTIFVVKRINGMKFCNIINFLYKESDLVYFDNLYVKNYRNRKVFYPNKRVLRLVNNPKLMFEKIFDSYCLNSIEFKDGDKVVDCGSNVGELCLSFYFKNIDIEYIGIEPDKDTFNCLSKNTKDLSSNLYNLGLSNISGESTFYLDNEGGNSSLSDFGTTVETKINVEPLDKFEIKNIKLLKIDAEGFEPEVLDGSIKTLKEVEYISIDFGFERGKQQESTIVDVNKLLSSNGFELVDFSKYRLIGLYRNKSI